MWPQIKTNRQRLENKLERGTVGKRKEPSGSKWGKSRGGGARGESLGNRIQGLLQIGKVLDMSG